MSEIHCIARFLAKDGCKDILIKELKLLIPETISESGCLQYELTEEISYIDKPWDVCLIERWVSLEDFDAHCNMSYIRHFFDTTSKGCIEKCDVRLYAPILV